MYLTKAWNRGLKPFDLEITVRITKRVSRLTLGYRRRRTQLQPTTSPENVTIISLIVVPCAIVKK